MGRIIISFVLQEFQCKTRKSDEIIAKTTYYTAYNKEEENPLTSRQKNQRWGSHTVTKTMTMKKYI
jgi:hypothetical protein